MLECKYASMQIYNYASMKVCKCKYENLYIYKLVNQQVHKYASIQVSKHASWKVYICVRVHVLIKFMFRSTSDFSHERIM